MPFLICKSYHLVFNGGTISGACAVDLPAVKGRQMQIVADYLMSYTVCLNDVTGDLIDCVQSLAVASDREGSYMLLALLLLKNRKINSVSMDSGGSTRFESHQLDADVFKRTGKGS